MSLGKRPKNLEQLIFKDVNEKVASPTKKLEKFQQKTATEWFLEEFFDLETTAHSVLISTFNIQSSSFRVRM